MKNLEKLSDNEHKIDIISLNKFLIKKGDFYLNELIFEENNFINKEKITKEYFQTYWFEIFKDSDNRNTFDFTGDDFPVEWYTDDIIKNIINRFKNSGLLILVLNSNIDNYYQICEEQVSKNGWRLRLVPSHLIDYNLSYLAVNNDIDALEFVPKNIENYYSLVKLAFTKEKSFINYHIFPKEYIPQLIKDFPEYKYELEEKLLKEYISKEVRKLLKEYYL